MWVTYHILLIIFPYLQARVQNRNYQNQLFNNIHPTEREKLVSFKRQFATLLADSNLSINKLTPAMTVGEFREILQRTKAEVDELSTGFANYLKKFSRFKNLDQFSTINLPEEFKQHAISINKMWSNEYPKESLLETDENDLAHSEENVRLVF